MKIMKSVSLLTFFIFCNTGCIKKEEPVFYQNKVNENIFLEKIQDSCVAVRNKIWGCSGFIIYQDNKDAYILTSRHLLDKTPSTQPSEKVIDKEVLVFLRQKIGPINTDKYPAYKGTVVAYSDDNLDIALIKCEMEKVPTLKLETNNLPSLGTDIYVIGHPMGDDLTVQKGIVSRYFKRNRHISNPELLYLSIDATIFHGNSGSPVITKDKKVIGMVQAFMHTESEQTLNQCISTIEIIKWLKEAHYSFLVE